MQDFSTSAASGQPSGFASKSKRCRSFWYSGRHNGGLVILGGLRREVVIDHRDRWASVPKKTGNTLENFEGCDVFFSCFVMMETKSENERRYYAQLLQPYAVDWGRYHNTNVRRSGPCVRSRLKRLVVDSLHANCIVIDG